MGSNWAAIFLQKKKGGNATQPTVGIAAHKVKTQNVHRLPRDAASHQEAVEIDPEGVASKEDGGK